MKLFSKIKAPRSYSLPDTAYKAALPTCNLKTEDNRFSPYIDDHVLQIYECANNPKDPFELRDLWLGRIEHQLGKNALRPCLANRWRNATKKRNFDPDEVLSSRSTVRFIKELFNWFFRNDLYGELQSKQNIILSSGSIDEELWGLPETLKDCMRYAIDMDWYGYSDSNGRIPAREAIASYESIRIREITYTEKNVAITMGATYSINSLVDFILTSKRCTQDPVLCGIPNYPPLVESMGRRANIKLIPLPCQDGITSLKPMLSAITPNTPMIMIQTAANPTGATIIEDQLSQLIKKSSTSTIILLDECHEWLGPQATYSPDRAATNVIRVSSISKAWSAPGLKVGWIMADKTLISEYYEYASTSFGGPPSFFFTMIEVLARMERWCLSGITHIGQAELNEFEKSYSLNIHNLKKAYSSYCYERAERESNLLTLRAATVAEMGKITSSIITPRYSINMTLKIPGWNDSYRCFREILAQTGVAVYPSILNYCMSESAIRITTAQNWENISKAIHKLRERNFKMVDA